MYQDQIESVPLVTVTAEIVKLRKQFEDDLTIFYAQVLQYLCHAFCQLNSSKLTRVAKDMIKLHDWDGMLTELKEYEGACNRSGVVLDSEKLERQIHKLDETMKGLKDMISTQLITSISLQRQTNEAVDKVKHGQELQKEQYRSEVENRCIQSFYVSAYEKQLNRNPDAVKGTCHWLLDNARFQQWEESKSSSLLWVSAGPGCGKSVASKMLIKILSEMHCKRAKPRTVCYFFFKEDDDSQRTVENALCAILHQILTAPGN